MSGVTPGADIRSHNFRKTYWRLRHEVDQAGYASWVAPATVCETPVRSGTNDHGESRRKADLYARSIIIDRTANDNGFGQRVSVDE